MPELWNGRPHHYAETSRTEHLKHIHHPLDAPAPPSVWCDRLQANCYEQPLGQPADAPIKPCRSCDDHA